MRALTNFRIEPSRTEEPLVSIIVVVLQACMELRKILENLRTRDLSDAEVIVVDGGSTDGSKELLAASGDVVDHWISEPDKGIYDGMNKGLGMACGTYVFHLNAGDSLRGLPFVQLRQCAAENVNVVSFAVMVDGNRIFYPRSGWRTHIENPWHHQGTFYRRSAHLLYDTSYRVFGDFDHNLRLAHNHSNIRLFSEVIADHTTGGHSSIAAFTPAIRENWRVIRTHSGHRYLPLAFGKLHLYLLVQRCKKIAKNWHEQFTS